MKEYVIGVDFGTDSVRALLVDIIDGKEISESISYYKRWKEGLYCDPKRNQFRQHPLDYIESLEEVLKDVLAQAPDASDYVKAISIDTTGSTPCLVDEQGVPIALKEGFLNNPNAMFILWKDHTAMAEAEDINVAIRKSTINYSKYSGGNYSSEWLWAKALYVLRNDEAVRYEAAGVVEHCDWIPALLTGVCRVDDIKLSRCSAGHKAMWSEEWGGFPSSVFLSSLDPKLDEFAKRMNPETLTCDMAAGQLSEMWAHRLGLSQSVLIGIGNTDAHVGAVGAGIKYQTLVLNLGTSACSMVVMPYEKVGDKAIEGISGQVDGSIIPGMIGFEAGMSAFGDVYAWVKNILSETACKLIQESGIISEQQKTELISEIIDKTLIELTSKIENDPEKYTSTFATDWLNGRRNPYINYKMSASLIGLNLSTSASDIYYAFVKATAFGIKSIVNHFLSNGIEIQDVIAIGGIPLKSNLVMQTLADILNIPIRVPDCKQACALGSAMFAAILSGRYNTIPEVQPIFEKPDLAIYTPNTKNSEVFIQDYSIYKKIENDTENDFT